MITRPHLNDLSDERGSALITSILILMVVTAIGIIATRTADMEIQIAAFDKFHKSTWFATESVVEAMVPGMAEQAIDMRLQEGDDVETVFRVLSPHITLNPDFFWNEATGICAEDTPTAANADIALTNRTMGSADIFVRTYGPGADFMHGAGVALPEGYHGFGKSLARGGAHITYTNRGLGEGAGNSVARISTQWRYVIQ
ncbi:pilus assembly PilX family protein [Desulfatitalea alkaliphila]|uniref:Pilus assembly PilX N-terminal domain-containing protein n=1 Tax=Desulfatitalea alkaliphila TaxID=2929485 RepID=A0AA41UJE8_9BACT|nr:pilus assembly PilX N-terminal domain-containing protein [Desulfatitalea alkaliphila]MCJ8499306.1 pilus assembly PilX N-terminal domain-containing protein [Desulfatitalea alkaliphila]